MKNDFKSSLQQREFEALKDRHRVILRWATGCGKSKMTIDLVNNASKACKAPHAAFIVAERSHIKNWKDEFLKWGLDASIDIDIMCYASLHKCKNKHYDILILDEAHHSFTEKRLEILDSISADYIYALSATLSEKRVIELNSIFGRFITSTVSLKEAIKKDILPEPKVYVYSMELDNTTPDQTIKIGNLKNAPIVEWKDRNKYIFSKKPCTIKCTQKQKYDYLTQTMEYYKLRYERSQNQMFRNIWVNTGSVRKRFLGELKTAYTKQLISSFDDSKRFICFCASVNQAIELDENHAIHSKRTSKGNQMLINAFNDKSINRLYAVGMATEGLNLADIQAGIIVQLDGKERLFIQKFGRSLRAEDPIAYIFYFKNTQDEVYLKNALENIEEKFIKRININPTLKQ